MRTNPAWRPGFGVGPDLRKNGLTFLNPLARLAAHRGGMSTTTTFPELARGISSILAGLRTDQPAVMQGFNALSRAAMEAGVLSAKTKELIALALGVAGHCDGCIAFHVKALVALGATSAEIEETLGVAVYMGGGPSLMYSAGAMQAFEQFSARASEAPHA